MVVTTLAHRLGSGAAASSSASSLRSVFVASSSSSSSFASSSRLALLPRALSSATNPTRRPATLTSSSQVSSDFNDIPPTLLKASSEPAKLFRKERRALKKAYQKKTKLLKKQNTEAAKLGLSQSKVSPYVRMDRQFKTFKPLTPSLRWVRYNLNPHLYKGRPEKHLTLAKRGTGGRNHHGRVTVRGRGGGHRRRLRMVDFYRREDGPQEVLRIEYDPGRTAHIALIKHLSTEKLSYILAPEGLREGDQVESYRSMQENVGASSALDLGIFRTKAIKSGNVLPLRLIPIGTMIHSITLEPTGSAKLVRSAGASGQLVSFVNRTKGVKPSPAEVAAEEAQAAAAAAAAASRDGGSSSANATGQTFSHAQVKLQSGEVRLLRVDCAATIGRVSNVDHEHKRIGKAGRSRWLGRRPKVRGMAMNAVDHPHGGGRGKSKSNMHPRSIYGNPVQGRTRKPGTKGSNTMVVRERPRGDGSRRSS